MDISTERQSFRALVADVAARAKAKLPEQVNGRIESAARLVLLHDVEPQGDGSILVGSSSDPMKTYRLEGATCTCQDFAHGQAPEGWCQHRIAAGIAKRVGEVLAAQSTPVETEPAQESVQAAQEPRQQPLPEAPASVNVHLHIGGREVQWTLRDSDETRLAVRLEALLQRYPVPQAPAQPASPGEGWCAVHTTAMHWNEGKGGRKGWYSHRTPDGQWCKGK